MYANDTYFSPINMMQMFRLLLLVLAGIGLFVGDCGQLVSPGVQVHIQRSGIHYAKLMARPILMKRLKTAKIGEMSGSSGRYTYKASNVDISYFFISDNHLSVIPVGGHGLRLEAKKISFGLTANYHIWIKLGFIWIPNSGVLKAFGSNIGISAMLLLGQKSGKPTLSVGDCSSAIPNLDIHLSGGFGATVLNWFRSYISDAIKGSLGDTVCSQLRSQMQKMTSNTLQKIDVDVPLPVQSIRLDMSLLRNPVIKEDGITFDLKGQAYDLRRPRVLGAAKGSVAQFTTNPERLGYVAFTSYFFDTLGDAAGSSGLLRQTIDSKTISRIFSGQGFLLNTTCPGEMCIGLMFSALSKQYPGDSVAIDVDASNAKVAVSDGAIALEIEARVGFAVKKNSHNVLNANAVIKAVLRKLELVTDADAYLLKTTLGNLGGSIQLLNTTMPGVTESQLRMAWKLGLAQAEGYYIGPLLKGGIKLPDMPLPYIQPYNVRIMPLANTLVVGADVRYNEEN